VQIAPVCVPGQVVPSVPSHCSLPFFTPSPQYGPRTMFSWQVVVQYPQVFGGLPYPPGLHAVFVLNAPSSHSSVPSRMPLPQPPQSSGHVVFVSPLLHALSPQNGPTTVLIVQLVVHVEQVSGGL
jgi:hypothetical protein